MSKVKRFYAPGLDCLYRSDADAPRQLIALVLGSDYDALAAKLAMAEDAAAKGDAARQQCGGMGMEIEELRAELAELRARVVVLPEPLNEGDARRECGEYGAAMQRGYNACLRELARINGMTVSEGLLRRIVTPALTSSDAQDRIGALEELRALLSEQAGGKP
ncbi:hypothetical protein [Pseudomonas aeruginosa]|uniref:hypothetical protein n=1 Tax=Pseudomonas aeruginosa TaxID=287 RepID=UPI00159CD912|nr:hypothetical protein [Pseudomonas aeruginosa]QKZ86657.1 hypothetical protein HWN48_22790 [Pseudomonas aeruginosa]